MSHLADTNHSKKNPLVLAILQVLREAEDRMAIHQLLARIKKTIDIPCLDEDAALDLYKLNWLLMNGLFSLQDEFLQQGFYLHISTLAIYLEPLLQDQAAPSSDNALLVTPLKNYYLDWAQFNATTKEQVELLLTGCWHKPLTMTKQHEALATLGLKPGAPFTAIKSRFRQLAAKNHPDRGGHAQRFIEIREAYQLLKVYRHANPA